MKLAEMEGPRGPGGEASIVVSYCDLLVSGSSKRQNSCYGWLNPTQLAVSLT